MRTKELYGTFLIFPRCFHLVPVLITNFDLIPHEWAYATGFIEVNNEADSFL